MSEKYLVIGGSGLVGSRFIELAQEKPQILSPNERKLDITKKSSIDAYIKRHPEIGVIINFAAYTDVAGAEKDRGNKKGLAWRLNVVGSENVAGAAKKHGKFLIHISTDFVFLGTEEDSGHYDEDAKLPRFSDKISWYGWTKLVGEKRAREIHPDSAIVRIAYPFRAAPYEVKVDFARKILKLYDEGDLYPLFADQIITPLFVDYIVAPLEKITQLKRPGIYHIAARNAVSYYDFGEYLIRTARGVKNAPKKGSLEEFLKGAGRNPRPRLGGLKSEKTQKILGIKFKTWKEAVDEFVRQFKK